MEKGKKMEKQVNEMFGSSQECTAAVKELAESIVLEEAKIEKTKKEVTAKRDQLICLMQQAGLESIKLDSGLAPKLEVRQRFSRRKDIDERELFRWLAANGLADIIRPAVHPGTLQKALEEHAGQQGDVPQDIFNSFEQPSIRMNGKTKFLNNQKTKNN